MVALCILALACGCGHFHPAPRDMVYVSAYGDIYLHDRIAAVSNHVAEVYNGEPLQVIERDGRFLKVKTAKGVIGWIEQSAVIDGSMYGSFQKLASGNLHDPVVATATLDDALYMHLTPGRSTQHFYLLPANTKVELLMRASVAKTPSPGFAPAAPLAPASPANAQPVPGLPQPQPAVMEDWWLARDAEGRTGWLLGSRLDVIVPGDIEQYAEDQRIVGAYVLTKVADQESSFPNHEAPEYLTVLGPYQSGLPYDFDEVRIFTWSVRHHRYETAFRLHPIEGFLPVHTGFESTPEGRLPAFTFMIASGGNVTTDPATGTTRPVNPRTIRYEMLDTIVKRIGPDLGPIPLLHEEKKPRDEAKQRRKR